MRTIEHFDTDAERVPVREIFTNTHGDLYANLSRHHAAGDILTLEDRDGDTHTVTLGALLRGTQDDGLWMVAPARDYRMGTCEVCGRHTGVHTEQDSSGIAYQSCGRHSDVSIA